MVKRLDRPCTFTGVGLMGGAMLRDFTIVATAFEVQATEAKKLDLLVPSLYFSGPFCHLMSVVCLRGFLAIAMR